MSLSELARATPSFPSSFFQFRFHASKNKPGKSAVSQDDIGKIVDWYYMVKDIPNAIAQLAAEHAMATNMGRQLASGDKKIANGPALETTIKLYIRDLKAFPVKVENRVCELLQSYMTIWEKGDSKPGENPYRTGGDYNDNNSMISEMGTPSRLRMVCSHIEREFATELALIADLYPVLKLWKAYIEKALAGAAGISVPSAGQSTAAT